VQTFDAGLMDALGRKHGPEKVYQAYDIIRNAGFKSVNLDLIFGIPHQTLTQWESDMTRAVELGPEHLSTYCLTFEEDTALYYRLAKGELSIDPEKGGVLL
jgi:oxygen-independent coproporphyrinogen-3 oxidase